MSQGILIYKFVWGSKIGAELNEMQARQSGKIHKSPCLLHFVLQNLMACSINTWIVLSCTSH